MIKIIYLLVFLLYIVNGQVVNNVRVIDHREYMTDVIAEVVKVVEDRGWYNLKLPDIEQQFDELVVNWVLNGTVRYTNGFVSSIEHVDVLESSLQQVWGNVGDGTVQVELRGQLRMTNVALGYDAVVTLGDGVHHFTGIIVWPLVTFDFSVIKNVHTHHNTVVVTSTTPYTSRIIEILPRNQMGDALSALFQTQACVPGMMAWATEVFQPIATDAITRVPFPGLCYNCPVS